MELNTKRICCPLLRGPPATSPPGPFARQVAFNWGKDYQDAATAAGLEKKVTNGPSEKMQSSGNPHPQGLSGGCSPDLGKRLMCVMASMCRAAQEQRTFTLSTHPLNLI